MRIAVVHSFYRSGVPSGENTIVENQVGGLLARGHDVRLIRRDTDQELGHPLYPARAAMRIVTGRGPSPLEALAQFAPDIVHVHNLVPGFGTSWLHDCPIPIVATMHNFRSMCANGLLFRDGLPCTECPDGRPWAAVEHGCYQESRVASIPLAIRNSRGLQRNALLARADAVICLSSASRDTFARYGMDLSKTHIIPNGVNVPINSHSTRPENGVWLAAGRLSPEKGLLDLARQWPGSARLEIIGSGPDFGAIQSLNHPSVSVRPSRVRDDFLSTLTRYEGLILPSLCIDSQPTVVSEALACGLPIVARAGNSVADLVAETGCGAVYDSAAALAGALNTVAANRENYSQVAQHVYLTRFTMDKWLSSLEDLYSSTLGAR